MRIPALSIALAGLAATLTGADDPAWTDTLHRSAMEYNRLQTAATEELAATRLRIATERLPFEESQREWQDKIITLEAQITGLEVEQSQAGSRVSQLQAEVDGLNRNLAYLASSGKDGLDGLTDALLPGEAAILQGPITELTYRWEDPANRQDTTIAVGASRLIMQRMRDMIGGKVAPGTALIVGDNELVPGTFLWTGPEVFFRADRDGRVGTVQQPEGMNEPVVHPLPGLDPVAMEGLFRGERGLLPADPSGGKALQLQSVRGSWTDHIAKGGPI